jgi:hypothetical protein
MLKDRGLTLQEIRVVLRLFPSYQLKRLSYYTYLSSPQLIDLITKIFPGLNSLSMDIEIAVGLEMSHLPYTSELYKDNVMSGIYSVDPHIFSLFRRGLL